MKGTAAAIPNVIGDRSQGVRYLPRLLIRELQPESLQRCHWRRCDIHNSRSAKDVLRGLYYLVAAVPGQSGPRGAWSRA
jgi:hypothetical protein